MAETSAPTDPRTLEAALIDQAQRTDGLCQLSSRSSPVGKAIPIANPAGAISRTVINTFSHKGRPTAPDNVNETTTARVATSTAINPSAFIQRTRSPPMARRLQ